MNALTANRRFNFVELASSVGAMAAVTPRGSRKMCVFLLRVFVGVFDIAGFFVSLRRVGYII